MLGDEAYHLELVRDADAGKLTAYVLDGELEEFIRAKPATFEIVATVGGTKASADWLKTTATFDGVVTAIEIKGTTFTAVAFNFPKGNDKD